MGACRRSSCGAGSLLRCARATTYGGHAPGPLRPCCPRPLELPARQELFGLHHLLAFRRAAVGRPPPDRRQTMADKAGGRRPAGQDLGASSPDRIRNVVLVGPGGSGKTTLVETLLASAGAIPRPGTVPEGTTICDFEDSEKSHERSISLAIAPVIHRETKINFVDTPGYADFVGEVRAGLRAADCALFVIAASDAVDDATTALWRECAEVAMPRAVVITKLDQARADYDGVLAATQAAFGDKVLSLYVPVRDGAEVTGLVDLLTDPTTEGGGHDDLRGALIEGIIEESEDESLMDRYLEG